MSDDFTIAAARSGGGGVSTTRESGGSDSSGGASTSVSVSKGGTSGSGQTGSTSTSADCPKCIYCTNTSLGEPRAITISDTTSIGSNPSLASAALSTDGLILYFSATSTTNATEQIFSATRTSQDSLDFSNVLSVFGSVTDERGAPWLSSDGLTVYFFSNRSDGAGERDLWFVTRPTPTSSFGTMQPILAVNSTASEAMPMETQDRLSLYYTGSLLGNSDIWRVTRKSTADSFANPVAMTDLNSSSTEGRATLTSDNRVLYFSSNRANPGVTSGGLDIWTATRDLATGKFLNVKEVTDAGVNSTSNETYAALSPDNSELFLVSNRSGKYWIYRSLRTCK